MDAGDLGDAARRFVGYEAVKAEIRAERAAFWGAWAADDERWERATGQRFPDRAPESLYYDAEGA